MEREKGIQKKLINGLHVVSLVFAVSALGSFVGAYEIDNTKTSLPEIMAVKKDVANIAIKLSIITGLAGLSTHLYARLLESRLPKN